MSRTPHAQRLTYYKVVKERQDYKGVRYFKFDPMAEKVVQVTVNQGEIKKVRANLFGVGLISRITFLCNYLTLGYLEQCNKAEYEKNFSQIVKYLK